MLLRVGNSGTRSFVESIFSTWKTTTEFCLHFKRKVLEFLEEKPCLNVLIVNCQKE